MTQAKIQQRKHPGPKPPRILETDLLVNELFRRMSRKEWTLLKPHVKGVFPRLLYRGDSRNDGDSGLLLRLPRELFGRRIVE